MVLPEDRNDCSRRVRNLHKEQSIGTQQLRTGSASISFWILLLYRYRMPSIRIELSREEIVI